MIYCSYCGKPIDKIPGWLEGTKVTFVCNNCPNRHTKNIALIDLNESAPAPKVAEEEAGDVEEIPDTDDE